MKRYFFIILAAMSVLTTLASEYAHPCMLHTSADIERVKSNISKAPWSNALSHLQKSDYAKTSRTASTSALADGYLKRMDAANWKEKYSDYSNYTALMRDAAAAYQLSLRYQLEGNTEAADAAVAILNAWKNDCKGVLQLEGYTNNIPDPNIYLINIQAHQLANAAELLRDYDGWKAEDFTAFKTWMKSCFGTVAKAFLDNHHNNVGNMHYWLNWDLANLTAYLSIGILCDDEEMVSYAIDYFKNNTTEVGQIKNAVPYLHNDPDSDEQLGQCEESGRDQGHATLCVSLMGAFCQMALNVGEDLFAYDDYRAVKMAEYVAKYNLISDASYTKSTNASYEGLESADFVYASSTFPYTSYTNPSYTNATISEAQRGTKRPCWEMFSAYGKRHGVATAYSDKWVEQMRNNNADGCDGGAGDYGSNSGGFDQLGYGTLMYYEPSVEELLADDSSPVVNLTMRTRHATLEEAISKSQSGDVLNLNADVTISSRINISEK